MSSALSEAKRNALFHMNINQSLSHSKIVKVGDRFVFQHPNVHINSHNVIMSIERVADKAKLFMRSQNVRTTVNNLSSRISVKDDEGLFKNTSELFNEIRNNVDSFRLNVEYVCSKAVNVEARRRTIMSMHRNAGRKVLNKGYGGKIINTSLISSPVMSRYLDSRLRQVANRAAPAPIPPHMGVIAIGAKGKLQIRGIPSKVLELRNVLYEFRNVRTGEQYIGKTTQKVGRRLEQHLHKAQDATEKPTCWQKRLQEHPENFAVRIFRAASSSLSLGVREFEEIQKADCFKNGLNSNGGSAYPKEKNDNKKWTSPQAALKVIDQLDTEHRGMSLLPDDILDRLPIPELERTSRRQLRF